MKRIILREFINGTGIISPDGWVYKDNAIFYPAFFIDYIRGDLSDIIAKEALKNMNCN